MPYCETCGAIVSDNANFCRNCGAPQKDTQSQTTMGASTSTVQPVVTPSQQTINLPSPPPPPPQVQSPVYTQVPTSSGERVLGVILLRKPKSLGRYDSYTGVVTNNRMIFAQMTSEMITQSVKAARDKAKAEGKGFWSQWGDQLKTSFTFSQRYLSMQPSAILAETLGNFALDNNTIREIKLKEERNDRHSVVEMKMEIHSILGNYEFRMDNNENHTKLLKQVYGERVKTPFEFSSHGINIRIGH